MKTFLTILLVLTIGCAPVHAQGTLIFRGQVYHSHLGLLKKTRVVVNNQYPAMTDEAGIFQVSLPRSTLSVRISFPLSNNHILFPPAGYVAIPKDPKEIPVIIVGDREDNIFLSAYLALYKQTKTAAASCGNDQPLRQQMDSLQSMLIKWRYTENEIRLAEKRIDGQEETLSQLLGDITQYRNAARDFGTTFKNLASFAFEQTEAMDLLLQSVKAYNEGYNKLDKLRSHYEGRIADYWQNDSLDSAFKDLLNYDLNVVHAEKIYPIQEAILQIRQYLTGKKKNRNTRKQIEQLVDSCEKGLDEALEEMEKKTNVVIRLLDS